jgi:HAD superfamily hydrolase (TIGR01509 family)
MQPGIHSSSVVKVKLIATDFSGVYTTDGLVSEIGRLEEEFNLRYRLQAAKDKHWPDFSLNKCDYRTFWDRVFSDCGVSLHDNDIDKINKRVLDAHVLNQTVDKQLVEIRKRYETCLVTNTSTEWLAHWEEKYNLAGIFNSIVASCEIGIRKPDERVWQEMLKRFSVQPNEAFYVDDQLRMVEAARRVGIPSERFTEQHNPLLRFVVL